MLTQFSRTELLLGKEAMERLKGARVAVFGVGGVGGYVCKALVRSGVGEFWVIWTWNCLDCHTNRHYFYVVLWNKSFKNG